METINTTIGYRTINNGEIKYYGGQTDNGWCYKDIDAWKNGEGVIYISEYSLEDVNDSPFGIDDLWTRESWLQYVKDIIAWHNFEEINVLTPFEKDLLAEWVAENCLYECDWQDLSTMLDTWEWEDCIEEIMQEIHAKYKNKTI
jgi:hypothetical protein